MKFTLTWLLDHIKLDTKINIDQVSKALTDIGLEVESIVSPSTALKSFIIAEVLEIKNHPNADRLKICRVDIGEKIYEVVCGATNLENNMKVVFAPIGTTIPESGLVLKRKEIRGITGDGMLCSEQELNIGEDAGGIMKLPDDAPVGMSFSEFGNNNDFIFDIAITPNRGDCASVKGIARELSAAGFGNLIEKKINKTVSSFKSPIKWKINLEENNQHLVPFVKGRYFRGLKNTSSPAWLKNRLVAIGLKPISALVDLTNFITYDLGRPLHVFDANKINGNLIMRMAKNNEKLIALDGNEYLLSEKNLIISDEKQPQSIAGVIGGLNSGCTLDTKEMFLESALFDKSAVAYNGRSLNILSDARYRFERGIDPNSVDFGVEEMTKLVLEICGGEVSEVVSAGSFNYKKKNIHYRPEKLLKIGGIKMNISDQIKCLKKLAFEIVEENKILKIIVPPWRHDINYEADIVEEILRINGFGNIPSKILNFDPRNFSPALNIEESRGKIARDVLARRGLIEAVTFSFLSKIDADMFSSDNKSVVIDNPISEELSIMRTSLLPNLLKNIRKNIRNGFSNNSVFEVSSVFFGENDEDQKMAISAVREGSATGRHWDSKERKVDVYDIKSDALEVLFALGVDETKVIFLKNAPNWLHPGKSGSFNMGKIQLGYFGEIHPQIAQYYKLDAVCFELFPENIPGKNIEVPKSEFKFHSLMPFRRDFSFLVKDNVMSDVIISTIRKIGAKNKLIDVLDVSVFDVYQERTNKKEKSIAVEVFLQPLISTLNEKQILEISENIISKVKKDTGAVLRS